MQAQGLLRSLVTMFPLLLTVLLNRDYHRGGTIIPIKGCSYRGLGFRVLGFRV